jgi:hypothetical protein
MRASQREHAAIILQVPQALCGTCLADLVMSALPTEGDKQWSGKTWVL